MIAQVWQSLEKKQLYARGVTVKLKLKNFQTLQHSKSFKMPLKHQTELQMTLDILLKEMQITQDQQFRLIGVGVYALSTQEPLPQLSLWSD
ncbi:DNA polymerase IV [compost metagenome]